MLRGFSKKVGISTKNEESKKVCVQVNVSDICSMESRSTGQRGRPRSSSQPTENNEKMIKEPFNSPRRRNKGNLFADTPLKRMDTMSNHSHNKFKSGFSMDGGSVDGALKKHSLFKNYTPHKTKEKRIKNKFPTLVKNGKKNAKKKRAFTINNIDEVVKELNSITSPALYVELLFKTLRERNKSLLRNVVDEIGMQDCTSLLREVALIQENGGMKVEGEGRMKTLGGVFFYLIRKNANLSKDTKDRIFKPEKKYLRAKKTIVNDLERLLNLEND